ncbi:MAG: hypothetical protein IPN46_12685 [Saprospiraceae bacterium]|nr:hypothetical protein [Saprospiraceae bacterium]
MAKNQRFQTQKLNIDAKTLENLDTMHKQNLRLFLKIKNDALLHHCEFCIRWNRGYAMFFIILFYGMQVMRSVMEEKDKSNYGGFDFVTKAILNS